ncbi:uncharacterized protein LOC118410190 [Branchiostoma floridae]|uniref:Uncharacterized protein LOC118410190 n=1 Tax=Branchiostoma floridae TaxID=7739 RepID=A0A9J7MHH0_BRAFL|nr:uncharacterized protein LOC118410190 [Branchiostoma floridae]
MLNVAQQVVVVVAILVSCSCLEPACFPGCKNTESWSSCTNINNKFYDGPGEPPQSTCISCPEQIQQQAVLNVTNSSQPTALCLPNKNRVAVRGFSFGVLSVQKLRPPQQAKILQYLALIRCGITDLEEGIWAGFPVIRYLQLDFNNLTYVKQTWFDSLKSPTSFWTLSLSHNNINGMESKCFQKLSSLQTLLLDSNSLQSIRPSWFHNLKNLGKLSLESNSIAFIPPQAFKSLSWLGQLDLSRNLLTCLSMEAVEGLDRLHTLSLIGNGLLALDDSVFVTMYWRLEYRHFRHHGHRIAVRVNDALFCITEVRIQRQSYYVQVQHDNRTRASRPSLEPSVQCARLNSKLKAESHMKYSLPLVIISVNTESDKHAKNMTQLCKHAQENVSHVKVALRGDITLQIVPMSVDRSCNPQIVAIVLSDAIANENRTTLYADRHSNDIRAFGHEEMTNVTCLVNTWEKTYQHVFTTPLSSTPDDTVCTEKTQTSRIGSSALDGTLCSGDGVTLTTKKPKVKITELTLNQTNPSTNGTVKEKSTRVAIITVVVVGVVLVALFVMYVIRRQRCCSRGDQAAQTAGHLAGAHGTAPSQSSSSGDDPKYSVIPDEYYNQQGTDTSTTPQTDNDYSQIPDEYYNYYNTRPGAQHPYWEIPDEYYNYYNTRPGAQHPYWEIPDEYYNYYNTRPGAQHPYWEIPDEYYNYYNTRPGAQHPYWEIPDEYYNYYNTRPEAQHPYWEIPDEYYNRYNTFPPTRRAAASEVALSSSTRQGGKHPSYDTAPQVWRDPQNYQIPARGRPTNIRAREIPENGNSLHRYMGLIGNYKYKKRRLSYPLTLRVPEEHEIYSTSFTATITTTEVVLPSSTRQGGKHPSYDTAPQVWRDPQNYQIPARGRNTNIRSHKMQQKGNSLHRYMSLTGNTKYNRRRLSYPLTLRVPQNYENCFAGFKLTSAGPEMDLSLSTRQGGKHPSYDTAPQVWRDPQNYQIPARGRPTNIRARKMPTANDSSGHRYMTLTGNYSRTMRAANFRMQAMPLYNKSPAN